MHLVIFFLNTKIKYANNIVSPSNVSRRNVLVKCYIESAMITMRQRKSG